MFARNDIIQFISRIIINVKEKKEARENILKFRRYLELTQMADAKTLEKIDKIVLCLDSILQIKQVMDSLDTEQFIRNILNEEEYTDHVVYTTAYSYKCGESDPNYRSTPSNSCWGSYYDEPYSYQCGSTGRGHC